MVVDFAMRVGQIAISIRAEIILPMLQFRCAQGVIARPWAWHEGCVDGGRDCALFFRFLGAMAMDLAIWLPSLFVLGLGTMGLLFAFVVACDHV